MNKLKNLFSKPLVSSHSKITPTRKDSSFQQETTKPEEFVTSQRNDASGGRFLKKSHSFFPLPSPVRKKKHSLPPVIRENQQSQEMAAGFDFEQFEELVDKKKLRHSRDKIVLQEEKENKENQGKRARRHSWSTSDQTDQTISQHGIDILKKFQFPPINMNPIGNTNGIASPTIRSPLNQSRADEYAGLLDMGDTHRRDFGVSPIEPCEEPRVRERERRKSSVIVRRKSERTASMTPQRGDREEIETDGFNPEKRMSTKENKDEIFGPDEQGIGEDFDPNEVDSTNQRDLFKKLSVRLALTKQFDKPADKVQSLSDLGSSDSNLDSLVEENPFEDEITVRAKTSTLKRQKTRLRDDKKYSHLKRILFPDDILKKVLDIIIAIGLLYTALVMPIRVSFIDDDDGGYLWTTLDWIIDGIFLLDIVVTFFSAYFDGEENLIFDKRKIAMHYLTGWFVLDVISIVPFHLLSDDSGQSQRLNNLVRVARLPRLYKLVKIVKLVRMIKIIKDRDKFKNYMNGILKLNAAYERLAVGVVGIFLFCHISACLWFTIVDLGDSDLDWLSVNDLDFIPKFDQYIASFYFVVQTVITVGYGELSPKTKEERLLACFLMIIGVLFYSLFIGFVSSLINDMDIMNQRFNQKLATLHKLQKDYALPIFFVKKLKKAIKYESKQTIDSKSFVDYLPKQLSVELFCVMHKDIIDSIAFLQNRPKAFIAALCPLLKPISINKKDMIFTEGDPADEIFFIKSGTVGYVIPKYKNECFLKVREGYFFGETDLLFYGETRKYTAMALKDCELYVLNKKDFKQVFLTTFRDIGSALYENAYKRKQRTRKAYKEALEICKTRQDDNHKHKHKLRLMTAKRDKMGYNHSDSEDSDDSGLPNALMGIVEEEEEEEEEIIQPPPPEQVEEIQQAKGLGGLSRLKAALALKRAFAPKSHSHTNLLSSMVLQKDPAKEEAKFGELHKKIDGLESKLAKLITIGQTLKSQSSKDLNSPGIQNQSLALSRIIQTPSNKSKIQPDPSPTGSDSPLSSFRSPNAMRRNVGLKKSENPAFKMFSSVKNLGINSSAVALESERDRLNTPSARSTYRDTYQNTNGDVTTKTIGNSEQDRMVITDNNYEMKGEKDSSEEEKDIEKQKKEEEERMKPVYKLLFKMGEKKKPKDMDLNLRISVSQADSQVSKTKSNLDVEEF